MGDSPAYLEQIKPENRGFLKDKGFQKLDDLVEAYFEASQRLDIKKNTSKKDVDKVLTENGFYPKNEKFYETVNSVDDEKQLKVQAYQMGLTQGQYEKLVARDVERKAQALETRTKLSEHFKYSDDDLAKAKTRLSDALASAPDDIQAGLKGTIEDNNTLMTFLATQKAETDLERVPKAEEPWDEINDKPEVIGNDAKTQLDVLNSHPMSGVID